MLELLIIPLILGTGFTLDFISDKYDDYKDEINAADEQRALDEQEQGIRLNGGNTDEAFVGTAFEDRLFGGAGSDSIVGGAGDDRIFLGDGNDVTIAVGGAEDAGDDFIRGGAGTDVIIDTLGSNEIFGDIGNDTIVSIDGLTERGEVAEDTLFAPDTVHAGYGEDLIIGDAGDTLTGGHDVDHFVVVAPSDDAYAPAVITDFDAEHELLNIVFLDEAPEDPTVTFLHDLDQAVVRVLVEGEEVATLVGLTADTLQKISAYVTTLPTLLESEQA
jgi:Ca2+-binding RTX toxin-like protein